MPDDKLQPQQTDSTIDQNQIPSPDQVFQDQNQPQVSAIQGQPQATQTVTPVQPDIRDLHPDVQRAHILRRIGEVLAGGKREKVTYRPDGSVSREPVPMSSKEVITNALANVLSSVGQVSGNLSNRMAGRPANAIQPLPSQVAQQQQAQQSEEDFNREQSAKVRKAKIIEANLNAMKAAYSVGKEQDEAKDAFITNHAEDLKRYQDAGIVEASKIPSDRLMKQSFDKTKYTVLPDGKVPLFLPNGERATNSDGVPLSQLTYSIVDSTSQTQLTPENYELYKKWGLIRQAKDGFRLPDGATISTAAQSIMKHKIDLLGQTQREIDDVAGEGKVDLAARVRENPAILKDVENFHNDAASQDPLVQLQNVRAKHPASAGAMVDLFGGQAALDTYAARSQKAEDLTEDKARSIVSDPASDKTSPAYKKAVAFLRGKKQEAIDKETRIKASREERDEKKQDTKDKRQSVYAVDPSTGQLVYSNRYDAEQQGLHDIEDVKFSDIQKDKQAIRQLNDVQLNTSRYTAAARDYNQHRLTKDGKPVDEAAYRDSDYKAFNTLLNNAGWADAKASISSGGHIELPVISALTEALSRGIRSKDYNQLSDQGKALYDGFVRTVSAVPAYQKALTGIGRSNKEMLDLELANIANPTMAPADVIRKQSQFQENLDRASEGFPKLPGLQHPREVRAQYEAQSAQLPNIDSEIPRWKGPSESHQ